jgi:thiosulfate dehydrogenase [quinone] large subunit
VPTARRIVTALVDDFRARAEGLRSGLATGKYDAYLLMPRGVRDEEFHTAVTGLLSDRGPTAPGGLDGADRDSASGRSPRGDPRLRLPDGDACRGGHTIESATGREAIARHGGPEGAFRIVSAFGGLTVQPATVRDVATTVYGSPDDIDVDRLSTSSSSVLRIGLGLTFLWAFFDKLLALGFHTGYGEDGQLDRFSDAAWINGGSPTEGFLKFGADGPFKEFYDSIGVTAVADWGLMLGLLGIGVALTLGAGMRLTAIAGATMYVLMWTVVLPPGE